MCFLPSSHFLEITVDADSLNCDFNVYYTSGFKAFWVARRFASSFFFSSSSFCFLRISRRRFAWPKTTAFVDYGFFYVSPSASAFSIFAFIWVASFFISSVWASKGASEQPSFIISLSSNLFGLFTKFGDCGFVCDF